MNMRWEWDGLQSRVAVLYEMDIQNDSLQHHLCGKNGTDETVQTNVKSLLLRGNIHRYESTLIQPSLT